MLDRRRFLAGFLPAAAALAVPAAAKPLFENASMRGSIDAAEFGIRPGALDDQSRIFARMLEDAHQRNTAVFMPPGHYTISNINLPKTVRLTGVPGATRIVYTGNGHLFGAEETEILDLRGIVIDGQNRWLSDATQALIDARRVSRLVIDDCEIVGSGKSAITLEKCGGRIERTTISGAQDYAIYAVESAGLAISANTVQDCGNGGILVHRWQQADDGTIVSGNRLARIGARRGGTGQYGNGINVFRANGVTITGNTISDCAFSAIRSNSGSNLIVSNNSCLRSGETALYSEFEFEGAIVSSNIVDGAANGISLVNFNGGGRMGTVTGNIIRNLSTEGPYPADKPGFGVGITVEADVAVSGNTVENAPRYGMHLGWGPYLRNVTATGNVIRRAGTGIAVSVVEGAGRAVITGNIIEGARNGAIVGYRWAEPATRDLAGSGASGFDHLTIERNSVS